MPPPPADDRDVTVDAEEDHDVPVDAGAWDDPGTNAPDDDEADWSGSTRPVAGFEHIARIAGEDVTLRPALPLLSAYWSEDETRTRILLRDNPWLESLLPKTELDAQQMSARNIDEWNEVMRRVRSVKGLRPYEGDEFYADEDTGRATRILRVVAREAVVPPLPHREENRKRGRPPIRLRTVGRRALDRFSVDDPPGGSRLPRRPGEQAREGQDRAVPSLGRAGAVPPR